MQFVGQVGVKRGYAVRAITANHSTWVAMGKDRIWFVDMDRDCGHSKAVDCIVGQVHESFSHRKLTAPLAVLDVINLDDPAEQQRCEAMQGPMSLQHIL